MVELNDIRVGTKFRVTWADKYCGVSKGQVVTVDSIYRGCADSLEMRSSSRSMVVTFTECTKGLREMLENNNNATNPKPPFDFHEIMIVLFLILLVVYSVRAAIWFLMH